MRRKNESLEDYIRRSNREECQAGCSDGMPPDRPLVRRLDLHKDPNSDVWAVSFIYNDEDGDIIETGTHEEMRRLYESKKDQFSDCPEYFEALDRLKR